jgi:hypothetical protein
VSAGPYPSPLQLSSSDPLPPLHLRLRQMSSAISLQSSTLHGLPWPCNESACQVLLYSCARGHCGWRGSTAKFWHGWMPPMMLEHSEVGCRSAPLWDNAVYRMGVGAACCWISSPCSGARCQPAHGGHQEQVLSLLPCQDPDQGPGALKKCCECCLPSGLRHSLTLPCRLLPLPLPWRGQICRTTLACGSGGQPDGLLAGTCLLLELQHLQCTSAPWKLDSS